MMIVEPPPAADADPPARLTDGEREALGNLARKQEGKDVGFITIADAQALTEKGLAQRSHQGWTITSAGKAAFSAAAASPDPVTGDVVPYAPVVSGSSSD